MAKEDDLTLQIGFEPDLRSLQKAAQAGAEAYSKSFSKELEKKLKLPEGYSRNFEKGHHLHNAQILAADDFIKDSEVQKYTNIFKEAILSTIQGLAKGFTRWSGQLIGEAYSGKRGEVNWTRGRYPLDPVGYKQKALPEPAVKSSAKYLESPEVVFNRHTFSLIGKPYSGKRGEVNWTRGRYPLDPAGYKQKALPEPELNSISYLEHPEKIRAREESEDFNERLRSGAVWRSTHRMDRGHARDIENLDVMRKGFHKTKTWSAGLFYGANTVDDEGNTNAPRFYQLRAAQFIKDENYRKKFGSLLEQYGGREGFFEMPAASTWKYHPLFAHGYGGLVRHTEAVMQGVYQDAVKGGYDPKDTDKLLFAAGLHDALKYQGGRPNSSHAGDMAFVLEQLGYKDEASWVRTHMGKVTKGYGAGEPGPTDKYQKLLADTDFLVSRQYAQFATDLNTMTPDMDKLREMAVEKGEGRWINPEGKHDAANWERIVKDSEETDKSSKNWLLNLRNIAGVLAVIHTLMKAVKAVKNFDSKAVAATAEAATTLPNRRYYAGYDIQGALENTSAAKSVGIDKNAVNSDVINFSANRGQMSLLGKGFNLLPVSILGQWQNMMQEGDANTAWWNTLSAISKRYNTASQKEREQLQKLVDETLGKSATEILAFSRNNNIPINDIRSLRDNPNWSAAEEVEKLNMAIVKLNESIETSYQQLYNAWEKTWGIPFREFWDKLLQLIVPNAEKITTGVNRNDVLNALSDEGYTFNRMAGLGEYIPKSRAEEEAIARSYSVKNFKEGAKATEGTLFAPGDKEHAVAQYSIGVGIRDRMKSIDYSNPRLEAFINSTLLNIGKSELDEDAVVFADDLNRFLKKQGKNPDKAAIDSFVNKYFDTVLPATKAVQSIPSAQYKERNSIYDRLYNGELAINIYAEMSREGRLDVSKVTVDGEDIVTKVNSIPANK